MYAHAIAQVAPPAVGVHLLWVGPRPWIWSLKGWEIRRRPYDTRAAVQSCETLDTAAIAALRVDPERRLSFGAVTLTAGAWPLTDELLTTPIDQILPSFAGQERARCDVFRFVLDKATSGVTLSVDADQAFAFALRAGKVVATTGAPRHGPWGLRLGASAIDAVSVYARNPRSMRMCVHVPSPADDVDWQNVAPIVKGLQLPLRELDPSLANAAAEYARGQQRLLAGETLDASGFTNLTATLRPGATAVHPPRPIDVALLARRTVGQPLEELAALDPIRMPIQHPKWRRVLGFGWFDHDPSLVVGQSYQYRITGTFPVEDLEDAVYGFHTTPARTELPTDFYLGDLRLRLPEPRLVENAPAAPPTGLVAVTRRGIALRPRDLLGWLVPSLHSFSLVIDFVQPVSAVVFELAEGHELRVFAGVPGPLLGPIRLPPGPQPRIALPAPSRQLRIEGQGFLFAVRVPSGPSGLQPLSTVLEPIVLQDAPRVPPPLRAQIANLETVAPPAPTENALPSAPVSREELGFRVAWRPPPQAGVSFWPTVDPAAPPTDVAAYQIERSSITFVHGIPSPLVEAFARWQAPTVTPMLLAALHTMPLAPPALAQLTTAVQAGNLDDMLALATARATPWQPLLAGDNWMMGDRDQTVQRRDLYPGVDLMKRFPETPTRAPTAGLDLSWRDVLDGTEPGTFHRYRIASVDAIGRPSAAWRQTNVLRLEKHRPPPQPAAPEPPTAATSRGPFSDGMPRASGVQARVIVRGMPMTDNDRATLAGDDNVILLRWGWWDAQRRQDPWVRQFRIYVAPPLVTVPGTLTTWTPLAPGRYSVTLLLDRAVLADAAKGLRLRAGYPFLVETHTAGALVTATLSARVPLKTGHLPQPLNGPIELPLRMTPHLQRPPAWSQRVDYVALTAANVYEYALRNRMRLTPDHAVDSLWVGVSAADDQPYVSDQLGTPDHPGNESAIVPVLAQARYWVRPVFTVAPSPPLPSVPVKMAPEPIRGPVRFSLDLAPYLVSAALRPSDPVQPERAPADVVFGGFATDGNAVYVRNRDGSLGAEVPIANDEDRTAIVAALGGNSSRALLDQHLVFLAGAHPDRGSMFLPTTQGPVAFAGGFDEVLPPSSGRWVYRVRLADAAGHLSAGDAVAAVVVRVPLRPGPAPEHVEAAVDYSTTPPSRTAPPGDLKRELWLRVAGDPDAAHLVVFTEPVKESGPSVEAELLRVPNRGDYVSGAGLRLRASDGAQLPPAAVIDLSSSTVRRDGNDYLVQVPIVGAPGSRTRVWACTLSRDAIPSPLAGPWSQAVPLAAPPAPVLAVAILGSELLFTWQWSVPSTPLPVTVERIDGPAPVRVSRIVDVGEQTDGLGGLTLPRPSGAASYRLRVVTLGMQPPSYSNVFDVPAGPGA